MTSQSNLYQVYDKVILCRLLAIGCVALLCAFCVSKAFFKYVSEVVKDNKILI